MGCDSDCEFPSVPTVVSGPRGLPGSAGTAGASGSPAWSLTAASFVMPAVDGTVTVEFEHTDWLVAGMFVYGATAGYFRVTTVVDDALVILTSVASTDQEDAGVTIASGVKFVPAGYSGGDVSLIPSINDRLTIVEGTAVFTGDEGNSTSYGTSYPASPATGDIHYKSDTKRMYRWNGSTWVDIVSQINVATSDITGQIAGTNIANDAITAPKLAANSVTADKVGANEIITNAANIAEAIIGTAHIDEIDAAKLVTGTLATINLGMAGRIFNPSYPAVFFKPLVVNGGAQAGYVSGTGTNFGFTLPTPREFVGPGHADAGTKAIVNPDAGVIQVMYLARIIGDSPNVDAICVFYRKNDTGPYVPMAALSSNDANDQLAIGFRGAGFFSGFAATDSIKFYCAPCNGAGDIASSVTCRVELDILAFNW